MNLTFNILIDLYSIVIISLICISSFRQIERESLMSRIFNSTLIILILLFVFDIFSRMDGMDYLFFPFFNTIGNFAMFALNPVVPSLWIIYAHYQLFYDERRTKKLFMPLIIINAINLILLVVSQFTGIYYSFAIGNIYQRGPLFFIPFGITAVLLFASFLLIIFNREKLDVKRYISLLTFAVPPFICTFLQYLFYGYSLVLCGTVISMISIYFNIQNKNLYTDFITSLSNRRDLERYLKKKVISLKPNENIGGIMLDIDHFKAINDKYGHHVGDKALAETASLLKSCMQNYEIIARFGGDEFFIVVNNTTNAELAKIADNINKTFEIRNNKLNTEIRLTVSIGYSLYTKDCMLTIQQFQDHLDKLMYENKNSKSIC